MTPILENAVLSTDLDCGEHNALNPGKILPVPAQFVDTNDSRMSDNRSPTPGSVTDSSVVWDAGIEQSKLNLNGVIPPSWLGATSTTAAKGSLAEYVAHKNQVNGYAGLDSGSKLPVGLLPSTGPQSGTVTEVMLSIPPQLLMSPTPITGSGSFSLSWENASAASALRGASSPAAPTFDGSPLPVGLIPALGASKFTTGTFIAGLLPVASGLGGGHAAGAVPDPGDGTTGLAVDYLGRDMTWRRIETPLSYQPQCPNIQITFQSVYRGQNYISVNSPLKGSTLFYRLASTGDFKPLANPTTLLVAPGVMVEGYASKAGYNNSNVGQYVSPPLT